MLEHSVQPNDRHGLALKHLMHTPFSTEGCTIFVKTGHLLTS